MSIRCGILVAILLCFAPAGCRSSAPRPNIPASPRAHDGTFQSAALGRAMKYRVLLPADYEKNALRYPVLYLLHGASGDFADWTEQTHVAGDTEALPLIVVMPDANDSWYVNAGGISHDRYEDYIVTDLINDVEKRYRSIAKREARAVAGDSMGGYGAVLLGLKHPELFSVVGSFGGAFGITRRTRPQFEDVFGPIPSPTRTANDLFLLVQQQPPDKLPYFWINCGELDPNTSENRPFVAILEQRKIAHHYEESPGGHEWETWDARLPALLSELPLHMHLAAEAPQTPTPASGKSRLQHKRRASN